MNPKKAHSIDFTNIRKMVASTVSTGKRLTSLFGAPVKIANFQRLISWQSRVTWACWWHQETPPTGLGPGKSLAPIVIGINKKPSTTWRICALSLSTTRADLTKNNLGMIESAKAQYLRRYKWTASDQTTLKP